MGFFDKYFREVWISLVLCSIALFYLAMVFLQSPSSFTAEDAIRSIPWLVYTSILIAIASAAVTPALYLYHRLSARRRRLPAAMIKTFE